MSVLRTVQIVLGIVVPFLILPFIEFDSRDDSEGSNNPCISNGKVASLECPAVDVEAARRKSSLAARRQTDDIELVDDRSSVSSEVVVTRRRCCLSTPCTDKLVHFFSTALDFYKAPVVKFIVHGVRSLRLVENLFAAGHVSTRRKLSPSASENSQYQCTECSRLSFKVGSPIKRLR
jgi:hypothetical protein